MDVVGSSPQHQRHQRWVLVGTALPTCCHQALHRLHSRLAAAAEQCRAGLQDQATLLAAAGRVLLLALLLL
jgi:hypothetical protein